MLAVNPALPYYALHFYHRHLELRHELGTEASLRRMRQADFPDIHEEFRKYGDVPQRGESPAG